MASPLPTPVAAVIGLVPTVAAGVRSLPGKAVQLPVLAVSSALTAMDAFRREYDDLADRGERLVDRLRGEASDLAEQVADRADEVEDRVEDLVARTPFATAYDKLEDAVEGATDQVAAALGDDAATAKATTVATPAPVRPDEQPKGAPTPRATQPDATRIDTAASASVVETVERVLRAADVQVPDHDELPLPDYDHMTLGSLRGRMRSLSVGELSVIRTYERAHADRLPVVTMLDNRIAKLASDAAATPSGPVSTEPAPEQRAVADADATASTVRPGTTGAPAFSGRADQPGAGPLTGPPRVN